MGYEIHIELPDQAPIDLDEWLGIVAASANLRPLGAPITATNPDTGAVISVPPRRGDCERLYEDGVWSPFLYWRGGRLSQKANERFGEPADLSTHAIFDVADALHAIVVGDEGEQYTRPQTPSSFGQAGNNKPWWKFWKQRPPLCEATQFTLPRTAVHHTAIKARPTHQAPCA